MIIDQAAGQLHRVGWYTDMIRILDRSHGWLWVVEGCQGWHKAVIDQNAGKGER